MATEPSSWHTITSVDGRFTVSFPGQPETIDQTHINEDEDPPRKTIVHALWFEPTMYTRYELVWQQANLEPGEPKDGLEVLEEIVDETFLMEVMDGGKQTQVDGFAGLEVTLATAKGFIERQRIVLMDGRVIQQTYAGRQSTENSPDAERFFSSLKLSPKAERKSHG
jgi:hypothetical protein